MSDNLVFILAWGDYACFTRPELKVERVSYPIMTPSAARGVLEAVFWEPEMFYVIHEIAVVKHTDAAGRTCGPGTWLSVRRNEVQSVISIDNARSWMKGTKAVSYTEAGGGAADGTQRNTLLLQDVAYLITAEILLTDKAEPPGDNVGKYLRELRHRAARGKCYHRPCLGCREFAADFELVEDPARLNVVADWSEDFGLMLYDVFDPLRRRSERHVWPRAVFFKASVQQGRMDCNPERVELVRAPLKEVG